MSSEVFGCHLCDAVYDSAASLVKHWRNVHSLKKADYGHTEEHALSLGLLRISNDELAHVDAAYPKNEMKFFCKQCQRTFFKKSSFKHFTRRNHSLPADVVKQWIVVSDGGQIRHRRLQSLRLSLALDRAKASSGTLQVAQPISWCDDGASSSGAWRYNDQSTSWQGVSQTWWQAVQDDTAPGRGHEKHVFGSGTLAELENEVPVPSLSINGRALSWRDEDWDTQLSRHYWPLRKRSTPTYIDLVPFQKFLRRRSKVETTVKSYVLCVEHLYTLLDVGEQNFSHIGCTAYLYQSGLAQEVFDLPILHQKYDWSRHIALACQWYLDMLLEECDREGHLQATRCLNLLKKQFIKPLSEGANKERTEKASDKNSRDEENLHLFGDLKDTKDATRQAMIDLWVIAQHSVQTGEHQECLQFAAMVALAGIILLNQHAGRPGEWMMMTKATVEASLRRDAWYLVCKKHKTSKTKGELAKYLAPGTRAALKTYLELPSRGARLFEPVKKGSKDASGLARLSERFAKQYFKPGALHAVPTLMRKLYNDTLAVDEDAAIARRIVQELNAHTANVQEKHYVIRKALSQAMKGKALSETILGGSVPWPEEALLESIVASRAQELITSYSRRGRPGKVDMKKIEVVDKIFESEDVISMFSVVPADADAEAHESQAESTDIGLDGNVELLELMETVGNALLGSSHATVPPICGDSVEISSAVISSAAASSSTSVPAVAAPSEHGYSATGLSSSQQSAKKRRRRTKAEAGPLEKYEIIRVPGHRAYLDDVQRIWVDGWIMVKGYSKTNPMGNVAAEQCLADGIADGVWSTINPPTTNGIRSRCRYVEQEAPAGSAPSPSPTQTQVDTTQVDTTQVDTTQANINSLFARCKARTQTVHVDSE